MSSARKHVKKERAKQTQLKQVMVRRLLGNTSCYRCQFLYLQDAGYSNYTVLETIVKCALNKNPNLKDRDVELPYDWIDDLKKGIYDRWQPTCTSMCEEYRPLPPMTEMAQFDVDGDTTADEATKGLCGAARRAIRIHVGK